MQESSLARRHKTEKKVTTAAGLNEREALAISRALSDPKRVEVFRRIALTESSTCADMRECLAIKAATLSHHIKQLETAGLIETVRDGRFVRASVRRKVWKSYLAHLKQLTA